MYGLTSFYCCAVAEIVMQNIEEQALAIYKQTLYATLVTVQRRYLYNSTQKRNNYLIFTNTLTDVQLTYSLLRRSKKMVKYLF